MAIYQIDPPPSKAEKVGQASRIGEVNPADLNALLVYLEVRSRLHNGTGARSAIG